MSTHKRIIYPFIFYLLESSLISSNWLPSLVESYFTLSLLIERILLVA